jgi:nucleoid-associated protein YgaU
MGLFSFLKNVGRKDLTEKVETSAVDAAAANARKSRLLEDIVSGSGISVENLTMDYSDEKVTVYGQTESIEDKEKVILMVGNVDGVGAVDDRLSVVTPPQSTFHEVQSGESLSKIAKKYYGDPMKYMDIFEANKPMLSDPDKIFVGQTLRIPNK